MAIHQSDLPPAIACTLKGAYLIEASAGTGKTWTLTGIILRLLIEEKYAPERMIATTFTRAAAAEMQERIQERLAVFHRYLSWLKSKQDLKAHWFDGGLDVDARLDEIVAAASDAFIDGADDPINVHLLGYLLSQDAKAFDDAHRRTALLLSTVDKLFVGTLDSLAQKWLKEFAAEIGHEPKSEILNDSAAIAHAIIHDSLRHEHARIMYDEPVLYELIRRTSVLSDVECAYQSINLSLQFFGAPIDEAPAIDSAYLIALQGKIDEILQADLTDVKPFFDADYRKSVGVSGSNALLKNWHYLQDITELMEKFGINFAQQLPDSYAKWLGKISDALAKDNVFNKKHDENAKRILMDFIGTHLLIILEIYNKINDIPNIYQANLYRKIALDVQRKMPIWLENQHKTTFTIQMNRLNQALKHSPNLARHIRHHYPVVLIDEAQDVNGAQVELVHEIYLKQMQKQADKDKPTRGFLLLVGDPKQAIYRFRGGDVANYNYLKNIGKSKDDDKSIINQNLTLTVNRRSNKALIDALNVWFSGGMDNVHATLGDGIFYQKITAHNEHQRLSWQQPKDENDNLPSFLGRQPFAVLHMDNDGESDESQLVAWHINSLLKSGQTIEISGISRHITPSDIAVLGMRNTELVRIKECLDVLNIPSVAAREVNVFTTQAGRDIHALMLACVNVGDIERLGRLLTSSFFGRTLDESMLLLGVDNDSDDESRHKSNLLIYLNKIHEKWQTYGIANALNFALNTHLFNDSSLWLSAAKMGERYLADIWQILALLGEQHHLQELALIDWYETQIRAGAAVADEYKRLTLPSESGVNLMTIHKSKGLEFPIVYVLGLNGATPANKSVFYPYSDENYRRRISPTPHADGKPNFYQHIDDKESIDERKRLGYVALTRASEQLYVVAKDLSSKNQLERRVFHLWCESDDKTLSMPERMAGYMDWINLTADELIDSPYQNQDDDLSPIPYQSWHEVAPKTTFRGVYQTSFTALVSRLDVKSRALLANAPDHDEMVALTDDGADLADLPANNDVRANFMRGVVAGDFLHRVLQKVNHQGEIYHNISRAIDDVARQLGLYECASFDAQKALGIQMNLDNKNTLHRQLVLWIYDVVNAPFAASGASLMLLDTENSARELEFVLGIKDGFGVADINALFEKYSDKPLYLSDDDNLSPVYRYLKGAIDLVYEQQGKFYVLDYKSNFLGNAVSDYHDETMNEAMDRAGYWLQAAIYQVALHRLLKMRIHDYAGNEQRYLGSVEYLFLRGVAKDAAFGRLVWQVPIQLVFELDALFN